MRKWMSERLKRRKKTGTGATKEASNAPAPEPLQPRFYDDEPAAPTAPAAPVVEASAEVPVVETRRPSKREPEPAPAPEPLWPSGSNFGSGTETTSVASPSQPWRSWRISSTSVTGARGRRDSRGRSVAARGICCGSIRRANDRRNDSCRNAACCFVTNSLGSGCSGCSRPRQQGNGRAGDRVAGIGQEFVVQASQHSSAFERSAARVAFR
jgi:hypothetical protein